MNDLQTCCVLVTPTSFGQNDPQLRTALESTVGRVIYNPTGQPLSSAVLRDLLPGCHGWIAGLDTIDAAALAAADQLQVIARYGAGVDRIDLEAARARGIVVTNTPNANAVAVAASSAAAPRHRVLGRQASKGWMMICAQRPAAMCLPPRVFTLPLRLTHVVEEADTPNHLTLNERWPGHAAAQAFTNPCPVTPK